MKYGLLQSSYAANTASFIVRMVNPRFTLRPLLCDLLAWGCKTKAWGQIWPSKES